MKRLLLMELEKFFGTPGTMLKVQLHGNDPMEEDTKRLKNYSNETCDRMSYTLDYYFTIVSNSVCWNANMLSYIKFNINSVC